MGFDRMSSGGANFTVAYFNRIVEAFERAWLASGRGVLSGLTLSNGGGLTLGIAEGVVMLDGKAIFVDDFTHVLPANETNYVWLTTSFSEGTGVSSASIQLTATPVDPGVTYVCLGVVTTGASTITTIGSGGRVDLARWDSLRDYSVAGDLFRIDALDRQIAFGGGQAVATRSVSATGAILDRDHVVMADSTAGAITLTLPAAASVPGRVVTVKRVAGGNNVTVQADGADTLDGGTNVVLTALYDAVRLVAFGNAWLKI